MLELHRKKIVVTVFTVLSVFLLGANATYAANKKPDHLSYRTKLGQDLDGDHKPETATIRLGGDLYQVNIHFTTGRPKLRLRTYLTEGIAGLSFQTTDIDNDNRRDLVITSATSTRPVAVWLNQGRAKFKKVPATHYSDIGRSGGPTLRHRSAAQPEPDGTLFLDPLPQAIFDVEYFTPADDAAGVLYFRSDLHPFDALLRQMPPRGPPEASRA